MALRLTIVTQKLWSIVVLLHPASASVANIGLALLAWDCNWTKTLSPNISCSYPQFRVASRSIKAAKFGKFSRSSTMLAISPACCEPSTGSALSMNF